MERYIGLDVHAVSCTLAVISESGQEVQAAFSGTADMFVSDN